MTKETLSRISNQNRILKTIKNSYTQVLMATFVVAIGLIGTTSLGYDEHAHLVGGGEPTLDAVASMQIARDIAQEANLGVIDQLSNFHNETFVAAAVPTLSSQYLSKPQLASTNEETVSDIRLYTVQEGETLAVLSERFNITSDTIRWVNNIGDWEDVSAGDRLTILPIDGVIHKVQDGESSADIAAQYQANEQQIIAFNDGEVNGLNPGDEIVIPGGILPQELRPSQETTQYARSSGIYECDVTGVTAIERISRGDVMGYMGSSGISSGKHLHFEVCKDDQLINPVQDKNSRTLVEGLSWPLQDTGTKVTRWYGCTSVWASRYSSDCPYGFFHAGVDITDSYSRSTPIVAIADGEVLFKGYSAGYGYNVVIRHENGYVSRYAHLSRLN